MQRTYKLIDSLANEYNLKYFDYMKDKRFNKEEYFYDGDHLSEVGAEKFSKILKQDLNL